MSACPSCGATPAPREAWLQINATPCARAPALLTGLAPEIAQWRSAGADRVWLLRKDPGLRLRLHGGLGLAEVTPGLERLRAAGLISAWFTSVYEPEVHQFGGPAAMAAVHDWFDADTRGLLVAHSGARKVADPVLSLAVLNDLFERCLGVSEEVWDVWCNLESMYRGHGRAGQDIPRLGLDGLRRLAGPVELELATIYADANQRLAGELDSIWRQGALTCGRRSILPYLAAFHWNRLGFDAERMATLSDAMVAAWSPKRGMRGAAVEACPA